MDAQFKELASLLQFRDKDQDRKEKAEAKRAGTLSTEDKEMEDWDKEMKVRDKFHFSTCEINHVQLFTYRHFL
jgi:hypothetical protein